jgi:hypothetical protein
MGQNQANYPTTAAARNEPVIIDQDMTPGDIVGALEHLRFHGALGTVQMDSPVRDLLVTALRRKA